MPKVQLLEGKGVILAFNLIILLIHHSTFIRGQLRDCGIETQLTGISGLTCIFLTEVLLLLLSERQEQLY